ncbi:hypothetical protein SLS60_007351 [Paraconiothyrium brasiliense]|uniref:Uncharacterized protein n=1 Tax=Paraconiothyrium brasiliense TaxID=300254 RepID=A0ABR3R5T9_9PLEO
MAHPSNASYRDNPTSELDDSMLPIAVEDEEISELHWRSLLPELSNRMPIQLPVPQDVRMNAEVKAMLPRHDYETIFQKFGYFGVVDAIYTEESNSSIGQKASLPLWRMHLWALLASIPQKVFIGALKGDLAWLCLDLHEQGVCKYLNCEHIPKDTAWKDRHMLPKTPAIYMRMLVNDRGQTPTPQELRKLTSALRAYVSNKKEDLDLAVAIDRYKSYNIGGGDIKAGYRAFLDNVATRVETFFTWCKAIELRCSQAELEDLPLPGALANVGYALCANLETARDNYRIGRREQRSNQEVEALQARCDNLSKDFKLLNAKQESKDQSAQDGLVEAKRCSQTKEEAAAKTIATLEDAHQKLESSYHGLEERHSGLEADHKRLQSVCSTSSSAQHQELWTRVVSLEAAITLKETEHQENLAIFQTRNDELSRRSSHLEDSLQEQGADLAVADMHRSALIHQQQLLRAIMVDMDGWLRSNEALTNRLMRELEVRRQDTVGLELLCQNEKRRCDLLMSLLDAVRPDGECGTLLTIYCSKRDLDYALASAGMSFMDNAVRLEWGCGVVQPR